MNKATAKKAKSMVVNLHGCARCGKDHPQLVFSPLTNAPVDVTHWSVCPTTGEPILLLSVDLEGEHRMAMPATLPTRPGYR